LYNCSTSSGFSHISISPSNKKATHFVLLKKVRAILKEFLKKEIEVTQTFAF